MSGPIFASMTSLKAPPHPISDGVNFSGAPRLFVRYCPVGLRTARPTTNCLQKGESVIRRYGSCNDADGKTGEDQWARVDDRAGVDNDGFLPRPELRERDMPVTKRIVSVQPRGARSTNDRVSSGSGSVTCATPPPNPLFLNLSRTHMRPGIWLALLRYS